MRTKFCLLISVLIFFILTVESVFSHPHMWIDGKIDLLLHDNGLYGVRVEWLMDSFNSADLINSYDADKSASINNQESRNLHDNAFQHLHNVDYFLKTELNGHPLDMPKAEEFEAAIHIDQMIYRFTVPISLSWNELSDVGFTMFDESFYISFLMEEARFVKSDSNIPLNLLYEEVPVQTIGWGTINVKGVRVKTG